MWPTTPESNREAPEPARTPRPQLLGATREAWRYYSLDGAGQAARRHLALRCIDTFALERCKGRPLAGHTPGSKTGLVVHLTPARSAGLAAQPLPVARLSLAV
jgi:hypothetical protein